MKTMLELLFRLQEMRSCCARVRRNAQLTPGEKDIARWHKRLVRECLPPEVLAEYDRMKRTERALLGYPEVFAMSVLVSTFRGLSPRKRRELIGYFAPPNPGGTGHIRRNGVRTSIGGPWRVIKAAPGTRR